MMLFCCTMPVTLKSLGDEFKWVPVTCWTITTLLVVHLVKMVAPQWIWGLVGGPPGSLVNLIVYSFLHVDVVHLVLNCMSIYNYRYVEHDWGSQHYAGLLAYFVVCHACIMWIIHLVLAVSVSLGFSGVLFGLVVLYPPTHVLGHYVPHRYQPVVPLLLLLLTQILIRNASFVGHLAGIISGYLLLVGLGRAQ